MGNGVPAHITILFPFVDSDMVDEAAVTDLLSRFPAFDFVLDGRSSPVATVSPRGGLSGLAVTSGRMRPRDDWFGGASHDRDPVSRFGPRGCPQSSRRSE
jgi:hypothetical protein